MFNRCEFLHRGEVAVGQARALSISASVARTKPSSENGSVAAESDRSLYPAHVQGTETTSTWDVHIGYMPPGRWDEMDRKGPRVRSVVGGHEVRPALTWSRLNGIACE